MKSTDTVSSTSHAEATARMVAAEDTLRAIGAGEVDAFVMADGGGGQRVYTLSTADRPYRIFVENMRDGAATISSAGLILFANSRLAELLDTPREDLVGQLLGKIISRDTVFDLEELSSIAGRGLNLELDLVTSRGSIVPVLVGTAPLIVDSHNLTCLTFTDLTAQKAQDGEIARLSNAQAERVTDLQNAQADLTEQATHDALTGLPNRALLVDRITQALANSKRLGLFTAVYFVDLDRFKQINDTKGHAAGNAVLRNVAAQMASVLRPMDTVARIGGDEFAILAPSVDSQVHAVDIGSRLVAELNSRPESVESIERVSASVGISVSFGGRGTAEDLLHEADTAMYQAKSRGGARAEVFDTTLGRQVHERAQAQQLVQSAVDEHRVIAHYQPVIDLRSGVVTGFEALARIVALDGSIVPPAAFIPAAEESGLVIPLGAQVLSLACEEARQWSSVSNSNRALTIAVNLSARQLGPGDFKDHVQDALMRSGLDPACLHLELTETAIMDLRPELLDQLSSIRDLGVQIGLDDFGTGYASLTHLRRLPLTFVKIDQSFVQGLQVDKEDVRIVSAVVDLAASLGLRSIAEGVETQAQLDSLKELGCDQAQGYLFSRPMPSIDVLGAIEKPAF